MSRKKKSSLTVRHKRDLGRMTGKGGKGEMLSYLEMETGI